MPRENNDKKLDSSVKPVNLSRDAVAARHQVLKIIVIVIVIE